MSRRIYADGEEFLTSVTTGKTKVGPTTEGTYGA